MKITDIRAMRLTVPPHELRTPARRDSWWKTAEVANPMSRYPKVKAHRDLWLPKWEACWCKVTLEDGTWGIGQTSNGRVSAAVIDDHLAPQLIGEDVLAGEKLADMLFRLTKPYGSTGLASYAVSAIDLALWDARGKLLGQPVYKLLGGPQKERLFCYATGNDVDWYLELGFQAIKLACPLWPRRWARRHQKERGVCGAHARADRPRPRADAGLLDGLRHRLHRPPGRGAAPYKLKWMEECLLSEDYDAHVALRQRLPWQTLATGEHWYTHAPFQWAIRHQVADILQPDINWCGGMTTRQKIGAAADAGGASVILHGGGNNVFGQHFSYATACVPWLECFVGTPPGVPLAEGWRLPGQAIPQDGWLTPSDAPGFGLEFPEEWLTPFFAV